MSPSSRNWRASRPPRTAPTRRTYEEGTSGRRIAGTARGMLRRPRRGHRSRRRRRRPRTDLVGRLRARRGAGRAARRARTALPGRPDPHLRRRPRRQATGDRPVGQLVRPVRRGGPRGRGVLAGSRRPGRRPRRRQRRHPRQGPVVRRGLRADLPLGVRRRGGDPDRARRPGPARGRLRRPRRHDRRGAQRARCDRRDPHRHRRVRVRHGAAVTETQRPEPELGTAPPPWWSPLVAAVAEASGPEVPRVASDTALLYSPEDARSASVLVLLSDRAEPGRETGRPSVLLQQRASGLRHHPGEVAFPGGAADPGDAGPVDTALREAAEELAVDPGTVAIGPSLPPLWIPVSGFAVTPVLALWTEPHPVTPDGDEVAAAHQVPLSSLADP